MRIQIEKDEGFFFQDVEVVAKALIGTFLFTVDKAGNRTGGKIVETEAYDEKDEAAHCHPAASARRRNGSKAMFMAGGHSYIFPDRKMFCLNFTTGEAGVGSAVLIRALEPIDGKETMRARRRESYRAKYLEDDRTYQNYLCRGPCNLCEALAVTEQFNERSLFEAPFELFAREQSDNTIVACGPRVGVPRAEKLERRYALDKSPFVSMRGDKRYPLSVK